MRGFADGLVAVALASYLSHIGFSAGQIGWITTATLVGSAAATITLGMLAGGWEHRRLLIMASVLMVLTGIGFLTIRDFWVMIPVAFIGTMNPSSGDVSVFLPLEQTEIAGSVASDRRTAIFARFSLYANLAAAGGSFAAGAIAAYVAAQHFDPIRTGQIGFAIYAAVGLIIFWRYQGLPRSDPADRASKPRVGLHKSRGVVIRMAALFSLDSLGGGFVVQTMLILWLNQRYGMSEAQAGLLFTITSLLAAFSMLAAAPVASKIGLVNTMVFTHLPAQIFLMATPFMPTLELAMVCLMARALLASMDVPARTAFVMAAVEPEERPAASSVTNVPRSLASAISPAIAGQLLTVTAFGWPLIIGGAMKASYDLILLAWFRKIDLVEPETR